MTRPWDRWWRRRCSPSFSMTRGSISTMPAGNAGKADSGEVDIVFLDTKAQAPERVVEVKWSDRYFERPEELKSWWGSARSIRCPGRWSQRNAQRQQGVHGRGTHVRARKRLHFCDGETALSGGNWRAPPPWAARDGGLSRQDCDSGGDLPVNRQNRRVS